MKEEDIRNREAFNQYIEMVEKDVKDFFDFTSFTEILCPACASNDKKTGFKKKNFDYVLCGQCNTIYVSPRPSNDDLKRFYADSPSALFWGKVFFKPVAEARREKIFRPRAEYASTILSAKKKNSVGDIGAGFGLFLEELSALRPLDKLLAIEPSKEESRICSEKGIKVESCMLEELKGYGEQFDMLTAFELFEHLFDPLSFLNSVKKLLTSGGHLLMTMLNGQGFDIQLLWERSKSLTPPHHLNFFNTHSISLLLERSGFEVIDISTPGKLDWDIVEGMMKNEGVDLGRFWNLLVKEGSQESKDQLQSWISRNNHSSHMRVLAKKKKDKST